MKKQSLLQTLKFTMFSMSAGAIQFGSTELLERVLNWEYWPAYLTGLVLSVLWNFTFNRRYTFKSAANVPVAMAKVFGFYLVFTPVSLLLGQLAVDNGANETIVLLVTMLANLVTEFLFCKFVVYRNQENTRTDA